MDAEEGAYFLLLAGVGDDSAVGDRGCGALLTDLDQFPLQETTLLLAVTPSFFLLTKFLLKEMTTLVKEVKNKLRRNC
jgi:hypothetical protein